MWLDTCVIYSNLVKIFNLFLHIDLRQRRAGQFRGFGYMNKAPSATVPVRWRIILGGYEQASQTGRWWMCVQWLQKLFFPIVLTVNTNFDLKEKYTPSVNLQWILSSNKFYKFSRHVYSEWMVQLDRNLHTLQCLFESQIKIKYSYHACLGDTDPTPPNFREHIS